MVEIIPIREDLLAGVRAAVESVAAERRFLGRVTLPPFDPEHAFNRQHIKNDWPCYVALAGDQVVGWADITPVDIPECAHRGTLGMGVVASHRSQGIGARLLKACLDHARRIRLAKVELTVFTNNTAAIALYRTHGFTEIGTIRSYRILDGEIFDALLMERWTQDFVGAPDESMAPAYERLKTRWSMGERDRELMLELMYYAWFHWADPHFVTGLSDANQMEAVVIWRTLFDYFGAEQSDDAEFLYIAAIMASVMPPPLDWHDVWDPRAQRLWRRLTELRPKGFAPADFEGRGDYGRYFTGYAESGWSLAKD